MDETVSQKGARTQSQAELKHQQQVKTEPRCRATPTTPAARLQSVTQASARLTPSLLPSPVLALCVYVWR